MTRTPDWVKIVPDASVAETFDELYAQLAPTLRATILRFAEINRDNFDEIISHIVRAGREDPIHWMAFREWAMRQPEVIAAPPAPPPLTREEIQAFSEQVGMQGQMIAMNRVLRMRATSDAERAELDREHEEMQKQFAEDNKRRFGAKT